MAVHVKIPSIVTLQFIVLLVNNNYFAQAQNHTSSLPTCFIQLLAPKGEFEFFEAITMDLTGSTGQNIVCGAPSPSSSPYSNSLKCDRNVIRINDTAISRVRITCHDVNPLRYNQEQPLQFRGLDVQYGKTFLGNESFQHQVTVTFPESKTNLHEEDGLKVYSGVYKMSRESPEKWEIIIQLNITEGEREEGMMPEFELSHEDLPANIGDSLELKCQVKEDVQPQPDTFEWKLQGQVLGGETEWKLKIPKLGTSDVGTYECTASNFRGKASKTFQVQFSDTVWAIGAKWVVVGTALIVLVLVLGQRLAGVYKKRGVRKLEKFGRSSL